MGRPQAVRISNNNSSLSPDIVAALGGSGAGGGPGAGAVVSGTGEGTGAAGTAGGAGGVSRWAAGDAGGVGRWAVGEAGCDSKAAGDVAATPRQQGTAGAVMQAPDVEGVLSRPPSGTHSDPLKNFWGCLWVSVTRGGLCSGGNRKPGVGHLALSCGAAFLFFGLLSYVPSFLPPAYPAGALLPAPPAP
ncbi:uncharacterized PE-PGRS family protein PE_PGRS10-like [Esox lucius]|uniref:uncharacterized PE-PGRS family protein PE_PGRS10-like n=1 Tax=Esox lucius TaxID=8010 RepID=UPI0014778482|nr:uncharacterized PE-PGRS family protein PE_PGRS10-like [Esox lucius]